MPDPQWMATVQCSWCSLYKWSDDSWRKEPENSGFDISHGCCPDCKQSLLGELRAISKSQGS